MDTTIKHILLLLSATLLLSCASIGNIKSKNDLIKNNQGQVIVETTSFLEGLNPLSALDAKITIGIKNVDNEETPFNKLVGYPSEVTLNTGEHTITFHCIWLQHSLWLSDKDGFTKSFTIAPGQQYLVKPIVLNNAECDAIIEDI